MAAAPLVPPDALKQIKPYLTLAQQLDQRNEKAVAYYCRSYAVQYGISINKSAPECKKFLVQMMDLLEATKTQNKNDESIQTQLVGQAFVEKFALKMFEKADEDDRQSKFNKNLVKQFYSAGLLFDVLNYFGELSEDLVARKQYAKRKAMYLNRCFQTGETPVPGPLVGEDYGDEFGGNQDGGAEAYGASGHGASGGSGAGANPNSGYGGYDEASANTYNSPNREEPPNPRPRNSNNQADRPHSNYQEESRPSETTSVSPETLAKAQKLCKYAGSALQYDDIPTAITNLEQCLQLLKGARIN